MSQYSDDRTLFHSSWNKGKDGYVVGRSSTAPQVCATGRLTVPSKVLNEMVIFSTHIILEPKSEELL